MLREEKRSIKKVNLKNVLGFLEQWFLLPSRDFTCSKPTKETLKIPEQDVKCVWS